MKKFDIIPIILLLTISAFISLFSMGKSSEECEVVIKVDGEVYIRLSLDEDCERLINTPYGNNLLVINNHKAFIKEADCNGNECMKMGEIDKAGECIVCLPHRLEIIIEGSSSNDFDTVAY